MRRHNQRLFRLARSIVKSDSEAEDVVQEAYVQAFFKIGDFIGPNGFSTWLGKIVINESLGRLRKRSRVVPLEDFLPDSATRSNVRPIDIMKSHQPDPERLAANRELRRLIEDAIDALPGDFRTVFVLRAVQEMSVTETAEYLSVPEATVKTRFHRARRLLQKALGDELHALMPTAFEFLGAGCDRIVMAVFRRLKLELPKKDYF